MFQQEFIMMLISAGAVVAASIAVAGSKRRRRLEKFFMLLPVFLIGTGAFCFFGEHELWRNGTSSPTWENTYPVRMGTVHYVNPFLHHAGWAISILCVLGLFAWILIGMIHIGFEAGG